MKKTLILIFTFPLLISCQTKSMNTPDIPIQVLIDSVENHGSEYSFGLLQTASLDYGPEEFLSTFEIMANKYNHAPASMWVYQLLSRHNTSVLDDSKHGIYNLDSLKNDTRKKAIRYLIKADSLGNQEAGQHLEEYRQRGRIE